MPPPGVPPVTPVFVVVPVVPVVPPVVPVVPPPVVGVGVVVGVSFIPGMGAGLPRFIAVVTKSIILLFKPRSLPPGVTTG